PPPHRTRGASLRARPQEPLRPERGRPRTGRPPAAGPRRDAGPDRIADQLAEHVHPLAADLLGGAPGAAHGHARARPDGPLHRPPHRRKRGDRGAEADRVWPGRQPDRPHERTRPRGASAARKVGPLLTVGAGRTRGTRGTRAATGARRPRVRLRARSLLGGPVLLRARVAAPTGLVG